MKLGKKSFALALSFGTAFSAQAIEYLYSYDSVLNGLDDKTNIAYIDLNRQGSILHGTSPDGGVLSGTIEQINDTHLGSGEVERFSFKLLENGSLKWFTGHATNTGWRGAWFGPNGEQGDFTIDAKAPSNIVPKAVDVLEFKADPIFSGGRYDKHNYWNEDFLVDLHGLGPIPFADVDQRKGVLVQSDNGGLPFPMSFEITFKRSFTLQTFRLGSINNGQGTRLTQFNFDVWDGTQWVNKGKFNFPAIEERRTFEKNEFTLDEIVTTNKIRVSAMGTADMSTNGRVFMWGLSFH
ncbi:hypothetical protein J8M20_08955 [Pseudoalteromonas luteoviolacea]|uniref:hypothetical protein n=1 Tax=Pseudoalteromonas luteoviolacea TaxID=43657 RepID=UPI001B360A0D|nr:hypothetical protein [Pseudoalteromonas luteoviolacea]MBQ4811465.1 hypothetical protein [Pseudoalteromonas luteoviolacea]